MNKFLPCTLRSGGLAILFSTLTSLTGMQFALAQSDSTHHQAYLQALSKVNQGEQQIADEMARVQSGEVAHYDFLQHEHIELIRHASALAYPPGNLNTAVRDRIKTQAEELLAAANALEWVIADFLRAFAQVRSASANTLDITAALKHQDNGALTAPLDTLTIQTMRFMASAYDDDWEALSAAFDAVQDASKHPQLTQELAVQKQLLYQNAPALRALRQALRNSDVDERALALSDLYQTS
jgi:hypothetical protein